MEFPSRDFSASTPESNSPAYINESQSLKTLATSTGAQRWQGSITTAIELMPKARALWAFLNAKGEFKTFDLVLPLHSTPNGVVSGLVQVTAAYAIGANSITFVNFTPAIGDFVRFSGHAKVYQVEAIAGVGLGATATIYPPLLKAVSNSEIVTVTDVPFTVRRVGAISKLENKRKISAQLKFKYIEVF